MISNEQVNQYLAIKDMVDNKDNVLQENQVKVLERLSSADLAYITKAHKVLANKIINSYKQSIEALRGRHDMNKQVIIA